MSARWRSHPLPAQFLRFLAVGAFATAVHYAVLVVGVRQLGWRAEAGASAGFVLGAAANYLLNRSFTFRSKVRHVHAVPRFLGIAAVGLALTALLVHLLATRAGLHYLLAQAVATGVVLLWNFAGNAALTFRARHPVGKMGHRE